MITGGAFRVLPPKRAIVASDQTTSGHFDSDRVFRARSVPFEEHGETVHAYGVGDWDVACSGGDRTLAVFERE